MSRILTEGECKRMKYNLENSMTWESYGKGAQLDMLHTIFEVRRESAIANQDFEKINELNSKLIEEKAVIEKRHFTLDDVNNAYLAGQETSDSFESWLRYYTSEAR